MTVTSTNYSSLDEVWGDAFSVPSAPAQSSSPSSATARSRKEKRRKGQDPICDLYEMGNNNGYNDNDIVSYANNYVEKYDKTPYQRTMNNATAVAASDDVMGRQQDRERPQREVVISNARDTYDVTDADDVVERTTINTKKEAFTDTHLPARYFKNHNSNRVQYEDDDEDLSSSSPTNGFAFIDLLLYIISGIILIFVMEQFVKIGLLLQ